MCGSANGGGGYGAPSQGGLPPGGQFQAPQQIQQPSGIMPPPTGGSANFGGTPWSYGGTPTPPMTGDAGTMRLPQQTITPPMTGDAGMMRPPTQQQVPMTGDAGMMRPPQQQSQVPMTGDAGMMRLPQQQPQVPMTGDAGMMRLPQQTPSGFMPPGLFGGFGQQRPSFGPYGAGISPAFSAGNVTGGLTPPSQNPFAMLWGGY